jgi:hypothetical protein
VRLQVQQTMTNGKTFTEPDAHFVFLREFDGGRKGLATVSCHPTEPAKGFRFCDGSITIELHP